MPFSESCCAASLGIRYAIVGLSKQDVVIVVMRIEADGLVVVLNCPCIVIPSRPGAAAVGVEECVIRIDPNGIVVVRDGPVVNLPVGPGHAATVVKRRGIRVEPDGLVIII